MAGAVVAQTKPQGGAAPRLNEGTTGARASAAGVLTLSRPQGGDVFIFDANDFVVIDFMMIAGQWVALAQIGRTLKIVFGDGSVIELRNFFSYHFAADASGTNGYTGALPDGSGVPLVRTSTSQLLSPEEFGRSYWVTKTSGYVFDTSPAGDGGQVPRIEIPSNPLDVVPLPDPPDPFQPLFPQASVPIVPFLPPALALPAPAPFPPPATNSDPFILAAAGSEARPRMRRRRWRPARLNSPMSISTMRTSYRSSPGDKAISAHSART